MRQAFPKLRCMAHLARSLALAVALVLALASFAVAKPPPIGKYQCYQYSPYVGYLYSGWFKLVSAEKYKVSSGETGKYKYRAATKKIVFTSGPYDRWDWFGKYRRDNTGNPVIDVIAKDDPSLKQNCSLA
jgi:hypothetical protein